MNIDLKGKTAVVTGGTGQLGRAMVRALAECGANVAICYTKNRDFAFQLKNEIETKYGVSAIAAHVDVADFNSVLAMKDEVSSQLGTADIIVNNAVIQYDWTTVLEQDLKDYKSQFESCVMQNVHMSKAFVPDMLKNNYGRVIAINTECAMQCKETQSAYVSGKRGMDGVLRVLAKEVGPYNITVNQVAPGWTLTEKYAHHNGSEKNRNQDYPYIERVPMHRRPSDADIANAVCFLASDLARSITGVYLPVCCGTVMPCI